jgi:splicing factor 45
MVGRGETDDELEAETAEECAQFGPVLKCVVHESQDPAVDDSDAVRIFVRFDTVESAKKGTIWRKCSFVPLSIVMVVDINATLTAMTAMNGRFFGGRQVKASFYDEASLDSGDLRQPVREL